ncbi:MAG: hypothetical protein DI603_02005 [Roseateles depolymerans]|uniref:DUF3667 domain-containing protein n=1 Tax=Roseateles depolymerans TaxID=76731 RepID=A0A2W5DXT3_9BURK|nr:MAG: hypothetical protein DI603_02005 [Roseateles depolymerans]
MSDTEHAHDTPGHAAHGPQSPYCLNCHYTLPRARPRYCGHCGQETDLHPPSVREMLTEYVGHYVAFDGPLWRTLWALVMLPGHLTLAYFHGRRRRYVLPLRVYLSASFLFFVGSHLLTGHKPHIPESEESIVQWDGDGDEAQSAHRAPAASSGAARGGASAAAAAARTQPDNAAETDPAKAVVRETDRAVREGLSKNLRVEHAAASAGSSGCDLQHVNSNCSAGERWLAAQIERAQHMTRAQWEAKLWASAPYAMLAMQPFFASLLLLMFAGSGRRYAEHFVFSLHCHSLWFLALLLVNTGVSGGPVMLAVFWHGMLAMRRVYGLSTRGAFWRGLLLSMGYFMLLALGMILLLGLIATLA